jgi:iron(III) transport system ATP-binding protein
MSVLSIRGLGKRFGATTALADLDLDVAEGSRTAVVGPSGSGKTTLLRLVAGFETPDSGEIALDGQVIATAERGVPAHRRNIGLVMQEGALFPHLSVLENIRFGIRDRGESDARARELMDLVELDGGMADRQPHQLSGGQQQRVALARALARRPRLMLLDEPFSALDTGLREQLRKATADILAAAGIATLLVTHDRDEAMGFGDQLVVLHNGRLAQAGHPRDLYRAPASETVAAFLGPAIVLDADVREGRADCVLGLVPLPPAQGAFAGKHRIVLRPEQLHLKPAGAWVLRSIDHFGPHAVVTVAHVASGQVLVFDTAQQDLPTAESPVDIVVSGTAWAV